MVVEERVDVLSAHVELRLDGREIESVYRTPDRKELAFEVQNGYCSISVPSFSGYCLIAIVYRRDA